jgi:hypothetical protein
MLLFGIFVTSIQGVFGYIQDTQCRAGLICEGMVMHGTQDEFCSMLLSLCASIVDQVLPHGKKIPCPSRHLPDAEILRRLGQRFHEIGSVTRTALVNAGRPEILRTPANEDGIITFVKPEQWTSCRHITREVGAVQTEGPRNAWRRSFASIPPHAELTCVSSRYSALRVALATTQCE